MKRTLLAFGLVAFAAMPLSAHAAGVSPSEASPEQLETAQNLFLQGRAELEAGRHQAALEAFRASFDTVASPNSHLFVARCLVEMGDLAGAYREYALVVEGARRAAALDPKYAPTQTAAEAERAELQSKLGFVVVKLENAGPETQVRVAGQTLPLSEIAAPIPVTPGLVEVSAGSATQLVMVAQGEQKEVVLSLPVASAVPLIDLEMGASDDGETARKRMRTAAYVAGGVGAAGLVTFAVAGSMARSQYATLNDECAGPCPQRQADIDAGRRSQTIANVGLAVGAVGLSAGTVLYLVSQPKANEANAKASPRFQADVAAGPAWVGVRGSFQ